VTKQTTKYALRRALEQIVPPHVLNRRKLGFPVPTRHWLAEQLHDWARQIIEESQTDEWLDKRQVLAMLAAHRENQRNGSAVDHSRKLWTLLVFMIWHGIFVEERIKPVIPETVYPVRL
jgi:asparagine synthase (glutamine-hydrolysing)